MGSKRHVGLALLASALALAPVRLARAEDAAAPSRPRVVVLAPGLTGDISTAAADAITSALHDGLRRSDVEIIASERASQRCADATCRGAEIRETHADALVAIDVAAVQRDYDVRLTLIDASGEEVARVERRCELCGVTELGEHVDAQAVALVSRLRAPQAEVSMLSLRSTPSGAVVRLDEQVVGETPLERQVELGTHVLRLSLRGYVDELRRFEALAGVREAMTIELVRVPDSDRKRRLRAGGFAALAIGTAALAAGLTLVSLHGRPNRTRCDGGNVDSDGDCKYLYATRVPGIVVSSVGLATVLTGVGLLVGGQKRRASERPRE